MNTRHFACTGTHSTGKTTVLDALKNEKLNINYEFSHSITRKAKKINKECTSESQTELIKDTAEYYAELYNRNVNTIEDRCFIDTLAYTMYFCDEGLVDDETLLYCHNKFKEVLSFHDHIFYFKTEFENVLDGVRVDDNDYRVQVEKNIEILLERYYPDRYTTISGTVEERVKIMKEVI